MTIVTCPMIVLHFRACLSLNKMPFKWYWRYENFVCCHRVLSQGWADNTRESETKKWLETNILPCSGWGICLQFWKVFSFCCSVPPCMSLILFYWMCYVCIGCQFCFYMVLAHQFIKSFVCISIVHLLKEGGKTSVGSIMVHYNVNWMFSEEKMNVNWIGSCLLLFGKLLQSRVYSKQFLSACLLSILQCD